MRKLIPLLTLFISAAGPSFAQNPDPNRVTTVQPKIMVIPFVKEGEDMRTVLDKNFNKRLAIAKVKNGFDNRGFTTKDFAATLKQAIDTKQFISGTQSDLKSSIIELSGADIYVEVDLQSVATPQGNSTKVLISAYDAATAGAYATINCDSRQRESSDEGQLIDVALSVPQTGVRTQERVNIMQPRTSTTADAPSCLDGFLNILQDKFTDIVKNGRPVKLDFSVDAASARNFESRIKTAGDKQLSDLIDDWLADNSFKNNYHLQGNAPTRLFYDEVRVPLYDPNGRNYSLNTFGRKLTDYLQTKGVLAKRSIKNGGLYITVQN